MVIGWLQVCVASRSRRYSGTEMNLPGAGEDDRVVELDWVPQEMRWHAASRSRLDYPSQTPRARPSQSSTLSQRIEKRSLRQSERETQVCRQESSKGGSSPLIKDLYPLRRMPDQRLRISKASRADDIRI